jgi:prolyl oligopeptidase
MRSSLTSAETVALDPNALSPDGSIALSDFVASPDGKHFAYGLSEGGSDWSTYYVRELPGGKQSPDTIRWVKFSGLAWTEDGKASSGRYRNGRARPRTPCAARKSYYALGTGSRPTG